MFSRVLLSVLIFPTFAFSYTLVRNDGKIFSGSLIQQTSQETIIKDPDGITIKFLAHQIDWNQTSRNIEQEKPVQQVVPAKQNQITEPSVWSGERTSFDFKEIDIKDLFRFIADISGLNVILHPSIKGSVILKLTDVPWDQALDVITRNAGLGYTVEGNVIRIAPLTVLAQEATARARAEEQIALSAPLVTKIKMLSYAKATEMERIVRRLLTPKGSVIADTRSNMLIITDIGSNVDKILDIVGN
ncbi:secretin and TonB N-terminal domain-containing protein [bacterium]|nr:secretin and TonB N-terminal domain-containing protein [bacterium]